MQNATEKTKGNPREGNSKTKRKMWNSRTGLESEQFMECQNWTVIDKDN